MKIQDNTVVSLTYDLRLEGFESEIFESATVEMPLKFIFGTKMMLPKFEENIKGLSEGDEFKFKLTANEAYGEFNPENVIEIPKSAFEIDGKLQEDLLVVNNIIPLQDQQGNTFEGRVDEILDDTVKMDFNHPMAGRDLYFVGKILEVREATPEELAHGHVH